MNSVFFFQYVLFFFFFCSLRFFFIWVTSAPFFDNKRTYVCRNTTRKLLTVTRTIWRLTYLLLLNVSKSHLNKGTGYPWAEHRRAKLWPDSLSYIEDLASEENLGPFRPTGSRKRIGRWVNISVRRKGYKTTAYLKEWRFWILTFVRGYVRS